MSNVSPSGRAYRRNAFERETVINFNDRDDYATLWTASSRQVTRWAKLGFAIIAHEGGWTTRVPKSQVHIRRPYRLSPDKLEAARARLVAARAKRGVKSSTPESLTFVNTSEPGSTL